MTRIKTGNTLSNHAMEVNQGCPLSLALFNIYIDDVIIMWQQILICNFRIGNQNLDTVLFADDQAVIASTKGNLQRAIYSFGNIAADYNLEISTDKTKVMAFSGKEPIRTK